MENSLHLINANTDLHSGYAKNQSLGFSKQMSIVPVCVAELVEAQSALPLAFVRVSDTEYRFMTLLGLRSKENLVLHESGRWRAFYMPQALKLYPFSLCLVGQEVDGEQRYAACIDKRSGLFRETVDEAAGELRFFTDEGAPSEAYTKVLGLLQQHQRALAVTQRAVNAIAAVELLTPMPLPNPEGSENMLKGIYRVDEAKFNALDGEALEKLHTARALPLIYAQLFSTHNLRLLVRLSEIESQVQETPDAEIVSDLFEEKDDTLKFNF